ncbi:PREDICTED: elicitor-responsive protein 3 isoform X2 [Nelumbo nucifera]|uniref:Elicitor-responsive protein 3 isoform X2 n=1 Tax=Nelumbo nucifera TaxID=4432 RepID=A0A1U8Q2R8_NELNU|nr:PREDICTED: elicitor-responsive protein 3 isoform X2 [Nelumbo nucifera]
MPQGTLEVLLVSAKGLENSDYLCNMDPYVILTCRTQEKKSSVASGQGAEPEWNENFVFTVSEGATELNIKIMDSDSGTEDDFVGEATEAVTGAIVLKRRAMMDGKNLLLLFHEWRARACVREGEFSFPFPAFFS